MLNKKIMIMAIFFVSLLTVSVVSAANNETQDICSINDTINGNQVIINENNFEIATNNQDFLGSSQTQENLSINNNEILSDKSPNASYYGYDYDGDGNGNVNVDDIEINKGDNTHITLHFESCFYEGFYAYDFNVTILDSNRNIINTQRFKDTNYVNSLDYFFNSSSFTSGEYILEIVNTRDGIVMDNAKITINDNALPPQPVSPKPKNPSFSVDVSDTYIEYGHSGTIFMKIDPSRDTVYKYKYYLKVYDSKNNEVISRLFSGENCDLSRIHPIKLYELIPGNYTIKIVNYYDDKVMGTAKLVIVVYPPYSKYSVKINDVELRHDSDGYISMNITPASDFYYYKYHYFLNIYDSNNDLKLSKLYSNTTSAVSESYYVKANQFKPGNYTMKIINYDDKNVMDTAKLTVNFTTFPSYRDYHVIVYNTKIDYGSNKSINMKISPDKYSIYKYYYYLDVYDSNNTKIISQLYYNTNSAISERYDIDFNKISPGDYTIKIVNYYDNSVMDTANLQIVSYPSYNDYSVNVSDTIMDYGSGGTISMEIVPSSGFYYKYHYYLKVYDLNNNEKISILYSTINNDHSEKYIINSNKLSVGGYIIKIINYFDNELMNTSKLLVRSYDYVSYLDYSVSVNDTEIYSGYGYIPMTIVPAFGLAHAYNFYLKVFDLNGEEVVSDLYCSKTPQYSITGRTGSNLRPGNYTMKIINHDDNGVMSTAKLTVKDSFNVPECPSCSDYSISVSDTIIDYASGGTITMDITPSFSTIYKYRYYLKVYDSKNKEKISQEYISTISADSENYVLSSKEFSPGNYTVNIVNYYDGKVMDTAKFTVKPSDYPLSSDYSVYIESTAIDYDSNETIPILITPASVLNYKYAYYYYLKLYDSNNNEKISQVYYHTSHNYRELLNISSKQLIPGSYTIKIINYYDNKVMRTATLNVRFYPSVLDYSVNISDMDIDYLSGGTIHMDISYDSKTPYIYDSFYHDDYYYFLKVYDSNNNVKISQIYAGSYSDSKNYIISSKQLSPGNYTMKIINYYDGMVMDTAKLKIISYPSHNDYSVSVSDINIDYWSNGSIPMNISPAASSYYKYHYFLKIYDSNNTEIISQLYCDTKPANSKNYYIDNYQLNPGIYTIKIINSDDNNVMDTATLNIYYNYPFYSDYSVNVSDHNIIYDQGGSIFMNISPATTINNKYCYYLKVYDSSNVEKISQLYSYSGSNYSKVYNISPNQLNIGNYIIKIINYYDNKVMDTAKLTVKYLDYPFYSDYSVDLEFYIGDCRHSGFIEMLISPALHNTYKICYYLKVYDSNNNEKISKLYSDTELWRSRIYEVKPYEFSSGNYTAKIINYYDNKVMNTANFIINKIPTDIRVNDLTISYNKYGCLFVSLRDVEGKVVGGKLLSINLNDFEYYFTDSNSQVKISTNGLVPNTYKATITFDGDSIYEKSTVNVKITVKKATPKLTAKAKTFKKSVKTKNFVVTLKTNQNKVMKNTKVTLKVNGKTYSAKTNTKGQATFKITKLTKKGKFTATIKYAGSKYYNAKTVNAKITVK